MESANTTAAVQQALDRLRGDLGAETAAPIIRDLLARSAERLHLLCATLLHRSYPRLTRPPLNLHSEEMLSSVVERMLKALREARPANVRAFFALANQHMRWELNDLARKLDDLTPITPLQDSSLAAPASRDSTVSPMARRILMLLEQLPEEEREVFSLVRIQGMTQSEVADLLGVSTKTIQRRLQRGLLLLTKEVGDLLAGEASASES